MPPKGYKKGYVRDKDGNWVDARELDKAGQAPGVKVVVKKKVKDDLGPKTKSVPDDKQHAKVIISWTDNRGRPRTTQYVMADLTINEGICEEFNGAKKSTRIHMSLDGTVLEKT